MVEFVCPRLHGHLVHDGTDRFVHCLVISIHRFRKLQNREVNVHSRMTCNWQDCNFGQVCLEVVGEIREEQTMAPTRIYNQAPKHGLMRKPCKHNQPGCGSCVVYIRSLNALTILLTQKRTDSHLGKPAKFV